MNFYSRAVLPLLKAASRPEFYLPWFESPGKRNSFVYKSVSHYTEYNFDDTKTLRFVIIRGFKLFI